MMLITLAACDSEQTNNTNSTTKPTATQSAQTDKTVAPTAAASEAPKDVEPKEVVNIQIEMQDGGIIKAELYPEIAPISVANFVKLCKEGFYDGLIFHRVIPGFMIQGGGYDSSNTPKEAAQIKGEFAANGIENNLSHKRGVISMARTSVPDSASSQFFIMHADTPSLDGMYAAFGMVTEGMDVVDKIATTETRTLSPMFADYPATPQIIKTIKVVE